MPGRSRTASPPRYFAAVGAALLIFYFTLEAGYSVLYRYGFLQPPRALVVYEESQDTILFDPVLGYRLTDVPARMARLTDDRVEYVGHIRGNAQGFSDRKDFSPQRLPGEDLRIAILGDSFSALKSLNPKWPERLEDLAADDGDAYRLMNFSVAGGGLGNWWSIMQRMIAAENYELDGVVFAVFDFPDSGDLHRRFFMSDHAHGGIHSGLSQTWSPETWPATWKEAQALLIRQRRYILNHDDFERTLRGEYRPDLPRPWKPYFIRQLLGRNEVRASVYNTGGLKTTQTRLIGGQLRLVEDLAAICRERGWPVLVVRIASREATARGTPPSPVIEHFAEALNADLLNGVDAFKGLSPQEIRAMWYPHDGHWDQPGSDRFADYMLEVIRRWEPRDSAPATTPPTPSG